jgi:hypothetical protein
MEPLWRIPMIKHILFFIVAVSSFSPLWGAAQFKPGTLPLVDGVYDSTQTVITGRQPVFSWTIGDAVSSFTVTVSADDVFDPAGELWNYTGSTTAANTINFITRVPYNADGAAAPLAAGTRYYWQVTLYNVSGTGAVTSASASGRFTTVAAAVALDGRTLDLAVDWNNPFNPNTQYTRFRFVAKDRDRRVKLQVFSLSGALVRDWPEMVLLRDAWYEQAWDGRNNDGEVVARGVYLVNLRDVGEGKGVTRRVAVVKDR